ncbi:hypothetical protein BaRGS_00024490 [Batillaria attramentaria]
MISIGAVRSFGVIFVGIQDKYGASASMVSLIAGVQGGVFSLSALVTLTFLIDLVPVRTLVMLGGLIASTGLGLCFLANSVQFLVITQGVAVGLGISMIFGPGFVLLGNYFVKRRAMAAPIGNTGGSIGGLVMPLVTRLLLEEYGLSGTYLLLAGIFAQVLVLASFFTPPTDYKPKDTVGICTDGADESLLKTEDWNNSEGLSLIEDGTFQNEADNDKACDSPKRLNSECYDQDAKKTTLGSRDSDNDDEFNRKNKNGAVTNALISSKTLSDQVHDSSKPALDSKADFVQTDGGTSKTGNSVIESQNGNNVFEDRGLTQKSEERKTVPYRPRAFSEPHSRPSSTSTGRLKTRLSLTTGQRKAIEMRGDVNYNRNQQSVPELSDTNHEHRLSLAKLKSVSLCALNCDTMHIASTEPAPRDAEDDSKDKAKTESPSRSCAGRRCCPQAFDTSLFKSPMFWLILLFSFFGMVGNGIPLALLPPFAVEKGLTVADGALLVMTSAALDILSRLVPGFVAQMKWMKPQRMLSIAFLIEGVVFQFTSLFNSLPLMVLLAVVHGLCAGVFVSMLQLIIIDFVGLQRFPQTFGFTQLFLGLSGATFFPLLGYLRDVSGTYAVPFHVIGACVFISLVTLLLEPVARRLEDKMTAPTTKVEILPR